MSHTMRKAQFAELVGCSRAYITQLAKSGRIPTTEDGLVLVDDALRAMAASGDVSKQAVAARHAMERAGKGGSSVAPAKLAAAVSAGRSASDGSAPRAAALLQSDPMAAYNRARTELEIKRGELMDIELAEKRGQLVSKETVLQTQADLAAYAVAEYERLPDRITPQLAAETEPAVIEALLRQELDSIRAGIYRQAQALLKQTED